MSRTVEDVVAVLERAATAGRLAHAYLVTGIPASTRRLAAIAAGAILGEPRASWPPAPHPDLYIVEPESKTRRILIEQIRALEHNLRLRPAAAPRKVAILVDADRLQPQAANAFLKTLEEPPRDTHLLLLSENPETMLETIISRCLRIGLHTAELIRLSEREEKLLTEADRVFRSEPRTVPDLLRLARSVAEFLAEAKASAVRTADAEFDSEKKAWGDNADRGWLEDREKHYAAVGEARYRAQRERILDLLCQWWGDALKAVHGSTRRALPILPDAAAENASTRLPAEAAFDAFERLDRLRDILQRNVNETLALDAAFLGMASRSKTL